MQKPGTILLVGEETDALLIERILVKNKLPYRVKAFSNGPEAIEYLSQTDDDWFPVPNFIITESRTPTDSGTDLLKWLHDHQELNVVPTIVFTSAASPGEIREAYREFGVHSFILKPCAFEDFEELIKLIIRYWENCTVPSQHSVFNR